MKLNRKNKLLIGLGTTALILISKLFVIQIIDDRYKLDADNNSMVYSIIYPTRGIIHDRNGRILVGNKVAYDLLVTPREVEEFDTLGSPMYSMCIRTSSGRRWRNIENIADASDGRPW